MNLKVEEKWLLTILINQTLISIQIILKCSPYTKGLLKHDQTNKKKLMTINPLMIVYNLIILIFFSPCLRKRLAYKNWSIMSLNYKAYQISLPFSNTPLLYKPFSCPILYFYFILPLSLPPFPFCFRFLDCQSLSHLVIVLVSVPFLTAQGAQSPNNPFFSLPSFWGVDGRDWNCGGR